MILIELFILIVVVALVLWAIRAPKEK